MRETTAASANVAIITGASQGIGAGIVQAYRKLGYAVVANSRRITCSGEPCVLTVPGDIAAPETGGPLGGPAPGHLDRAGTHAYKARVVPGTALRHFNHPRVEP